MFEAFQTVFYDPDAPVASPVWALVLGAVAVLTFVAQHAFFAPTTGAMIVYIAAFTVFLGGLGSALIVRAQGRLLPVTIAHLLVNLMTSPPAVVFPILVHAGVVEV